MKIKFIYFLLFNLIIFSFLIYIHNIRFCNNPIFNFFLKKCKCINYYNHNNNFNLFDIKKKCIIFYPYIINIKIYNYIYYLFLYIIF